MNRWRPRMHEVETPELLELRLVNASAPDFLKDGIHMNAVDTGWITDEDPAVHAERKAEAGFSPPLDASMTLRHTAAAQGSHEQ
jgi:hypothetical protein